MPCNSDAHKDVEAALKARQAAPRAESCDAELRASIEATEREVEHEHEALQQARLVAAQLRIDACSQSALTQPRCART